MRRIHRNITALVCAGVLALSGCSTGGGKASADDSAAKTHTVTDAAGEKVDVPVKPARVLTMHYAGTQAALDLGVKLVGQGPFEEPNTPADYVKTLKDVPVVVDNNMQPDLEKISELEPDLILAPNILKPDQLEQLKKIGPVFQWTLRGKDRADWKLRVKEIAEATNTSESYAKLDSDFDKQIKDTAAEHADVIKGKTVGVISSYTENNAYVWGEKNMSGTLLTPLGFTWSAKENSAASKECEPEGEISAEKVGETFDDVDVLFYDTNLKDETNPFLTKIQKGPLYQNLPAVRSKHAYPFGKTTIAGFTDARHCLEQISKALASMK